MFTDTRATAAGDSRVYVISYLYDRSTLTSDDGSEVSDGIRELIQNRIDEITAEVERLRVALAALVSESAAAPAAAPARRRTRAAGGASDESAGQARRAARRADGESGRTSPGATRDAVLAALAGGEPMTAGQVAERSGLARGTVSTTLSRLARTGAVEKAERGYRLTS